jgi:hypothetical protein
MQLTRKMFIHLFIPTKNQPLMKNSKWLVINCGDKGNRTPDLVNAIHAL